MFRSFVVPSLLLLAACGQQDAAPAPDTNTEANVAKTADTSAPTQSAVPTADKPKLDGDWSVVDVKGDPVSGVGVGFHGGLATVSAGCLKRSWSYTQNGGAVTFKPGGVGANCGRSTTVAEETVFQALSESNMAIFEDDGRKVSLTGYGGSVTLARR